MPSTSADDILKKIEDITKNIINERNGFDREMTLDPTSSICSIIGIYYNYKSITSCKN
jgi:hypothetical protein